VLEIKSSDLAERLARFIDELRARYEPMPHFGGDRGTASPPVTARPPRDV